MSNLFYEQLEKQSNGTDLKEFAIAELEKIKQEIHKLAFDDDDGDYMTLIDDDEAMELIDKHIAELKGETE